MSTTTPQTLELKGQEFTLLFTNVVRNNTTRPIGGRGHDDREMFPAWVWKGDLAIIDHWFGNKVERPFHTDTFCQAHVQNRPFEEVLFLAVNTHLFLLEGLGSDSRSRIIDHLAKKAIQAFTFNRGQPIHIEPLRFKDDRDPQGTHCLERQPVFARFTRIEPVLELVAVP